MQDVAEVVSEGVESMSAKSVFGEPFERNGVAIVPVARVRGGVGGGGGEGSSEGQGKGIGSGFGVSARPAGAFVVRGDRVSWLAALDLNRVFLGGQIVAIVALLTARSVLRARAKASRVCG